MSIRYYPETKEIICPVGDTGNLKFTITHKDKEGNAIPFSQGDMALFCVCEVKKDGSYQDAAYLKSAINVEENTASVRISNHFSSMLEAGRDYRWDVRIVTSPAYDAEGEICCDDSSDDVHSVFALDGDLPRFTVRGTAREIVTMEGQEG